jgi:hypothetical protein
MKILNLCEELNHKVYKTPWGLSSVSSSAKRGWVMDKKIL